MFFFFKQKTAYDMRISDWSSDVCSSDLQTKLRHDRAQKFAAPLARFDEQHLPRTQDRNDQPRQSRPAPQVDPKPLALTRIERKQLRAVGDMPHPNCRNRRHGDQILRSEEHTSELQSIMSISYAVFCLKKK